MTCSFDDYNRVDVDLRTNPEVTDADIMEQSRDAPDDKLSETEESQTNVQCTFTDDTIG